MDKPPGPKHQANATIQIDRVDLNEILLLDTSDEEPIGAASVPPPLPPDELARAASLAPIGSMAPAAPAKPGRGLMIGLGFVAILAIAITAGVLVGKAVRTPQPAAASNAPASPPATQTETAPASAAPPTPTAATQTITIHTMELGGKETRDQ